ncbi:MAG: AAA family ATPase [Planctomycetaceae bacterium]
MPQNNGACQNNNGAKQRVPCTGLCVPKPGYENLRWNVPYRKFKSPAIGVFPFENTLQCLYSRLVLNSKLRRTINSIKSVSFKNFKCFSTEAKIELRPLTLFYGYNNSGKSALLRGVCMVVNSLLKNGSEPLDRRLPVFSSDMMLEEIVTQETGELQQGRLELRVQLTPSMQRLSWKFFSLPERQTYVVSHFTVEASDGTIELVAEWLTNETPDGWIGNTY